MQILNILKFTPVYVYPLFGYLIFMGIKATKPKAINSPIKLFITPVIFLLFSLKKISNMQNFLWFILIISISFFINYKLLNSLPMQIANNTIIIPGSWQPLLTIVSLFSVKYYIGYLKVALPEATPQYNTINLAVSGIILSFTFFKICFYYKYYIDRVKK